MSCLRYNKVFYANGVGKGKEPPGTWSTELAPSRARQLLCFVFSLQLLPQLVVLRPQMEVTVGLGEINGRTD